MFFSHSIWTSSSLDVPTGVTQEEGHTGFLIHLLSAVRALVFLARRIQPFLSLVDREVEFCVVDVVVSHIQRIGCQPKKTTLYGGQSRSWSAEQGGKKKSGSPPPRACCSFGENRRNKKSHGASTCLGATQVGVSQVVSVRLASVQRIPTTRRLGQWVSLRKIVRFRVRLQLSQSRCLSLLLVMSGLVFLLFRPRGHEPPPTLRDRLNPNLSF